MTLSGAAFLYNFGFFTLLAYSPFVLDLNERGLGYVFFGWGLFLAITSVFIAPAVQRIFGTVRSLIFLFMLFAADLLAIGIWTEHMALVIGAIIIAGGILGMINTILTTAVMEAAPVERSVASSAYSSIRFIGGAIAPWIAGVLADHFTAHTPYFAGCIAVLAGMAVLTGGRRYLAGIKAGH